MPESCLDCIGSLLVDQATTLCKSLRLLSGPLMSQTAEAGRPPVCLGSFHNRSSVLWTLVSCQLLLRAVRMMFFIIALPIVQCLLISLCVGEHPTGLHLGVVNSELSENTYCPTKLGLPQCLPGNGPPFSCFILQNLPSGSIITSHHRTIEIGKRAVIKNREWGLIHFNRNYSAALWERLKYFLSNDTILNESEMIVWMDSSNKIISDFLKLHLTQSILGFIKEIGRICNWFYNGTIFLKLEQPIYGTMQTSFRQFMTPANAVLQMFYIPMMFTTGALLMEKSSGLLRRSLVTGLSLVEVGLGHFVLQCVIIVIQGSLVWFVLFYIFDNPFEGNVIPCFTLLLLVGICGMFYGFFIVAISSSYTACAFLALGGYFPLFVLSGALWPLEGMHNWLRFMARLSPITTSIESFRALSVRGAPVTDAVVCLGVLSLISWSGIFIFSTALIIRFKGLNT